MVTGHEMENNPQLTHTHSTHALGVFIPSILFLLHKYILSRIFTFYEFQYIIQTVYIPYPCISICIYSKCNCVTSSPIVSTASCKNHKAREHWRDYSCIPLLRWTTQARRWWQLCSTRFSHRGCCSKRAWCVHPPPPICCAFFCLKGSRTRSCSCNFDFNGTDSYGQSYPKRYYSMIFSWLCSGLKNFNSMHSFLQW